MFVLVARIKSRFMSNSRMRLFATVIHPSRTQWNKVKQMEPNRNNMSELETEVAEELLTEIIFLAITSSDRLRDSWIKLADGIAVLIAPEKVERCKDYASYRARNS